MEPAAFPLHLTLKVEEGEEETQSPDLEDGPTDTQKVRICSESAWVSQGAGGRAAEQQGPGAGLCVKPPCPPAPRPQDGLGKYTWPSPAGVPARLRKPCWAFKRRRGNRAGYLSSPPDRPGGRAQPLLVPALPAPRSRPATWSAPLSVCSLTEKKSCSDFG